MSGQLNTGMIAEDSQLWDEGSYVTMSGQHDTDNHCAEYLDIADANATYSMIENELNKSDHHNDNQNATYENVQSDELDHGTELKENIKKKGRKGIEKQHVYSNASNFRNTTLPGAKSMKMQNSAEGIKIDKQNESVYSYACPDMPNAVQTEEKRQSLMKTQNSNGTFKLSPSRFSQPAALSTKSKPLLSTSSMPFIEERNEVFDNTEQIHKIADSEQRKFINSSSQDFEMVSKEISPSGSKKKANLAYQSRESAVMTDNYAIGYLNNAIKSNRRWKIFLTVVIAMITLTAVMIFFQVMQILKPKHFFKNSDKHLLKFLSERTMRLELQTIARGKEIAALRQITKYQESQINSMKNLVKLYQLRQNMSSIHTSAANKRNDGLQRLKRNIAEAQLDIGKNDKMTNDVINNVNNFLMTKISTMQMTPGPKGSTGMTGKYSFNSCRLQTNSNNAIITDDVNSFSTSTFFVIQTDSTVMGGYCSSPNTKVALMDTYSDKNRMTCICREAYAKAKGKAANCQITVFLCPTIES